MYPLHLPCKCNISISYSRYLIIENEYFYSNLSHIKFKLLILRVGRRGIDYAKGVELIRPSPVRTSVSCVVC